MKTLFVTSVVFGAYEIDGAVGHVAVVVCEDEIASGVGRLATGSGADQNDAIDNFVDDDSVANNANFSYNGNKEEYISSNYESDCREDYISSNNDSDDI
ncbi:hypothetical protein ACOSQ2_010266 [Xanthoceras sorbifolium]